MTRKTSRRFTNYSKQSDDQQFSEQMPQQQSQQPQYQHSHQPLAGYDHTERDNDSAIADMAQGFIQAQAKMSDKGANANNLEIALLLQKCNDQLEEIRRSAQGNSNSNSASNQSNKNSTVQDIGGQDNKQQVSGMPSQDLQGLLASLLQGKTDNGNSATQSSTMASNSKNNNNASGGNQQNMMAVQNVSQVLAQAQYELANELENSLKKLKQVISESEKIANNISNLLGEEATKKS